MRANVTVDELNRLTSLIHASSLDWQHWSEFVETASEVSGGARCAIYGFDMQTQTPFSIAQANFDPEFVDSYFNYYGNISPWPLALGAVPVGQAVRAEHMVPDDQLRTTEFYNDWVRPQDDIAHGAGVTLVREAERVVVFSGNLRRKDADDLETNLVSLIGLLTPHIQQALEVSRLLVGRSLSEAATADAEPGAALLVVTASGRIAFANRRAEALLENGTVVGRDLRGRIILPLATQSAVRQFLAEMGGEVVPLPRSLPLIDAQGRRWQAKVAVLDALDQGWSPFGVLYELTGRCMLLTLAPLSAEATQGHRLALQFGLSCSEADVVLSLAGGLSLAEIADARRVSIHTVRNQVKAALSKTGSRRQADLVRLVERLR